MWFPLGVRDLATGTWGQASWRPSEQQGFLLEVIPLPEGQAVKLLHTHRKHLLELLRGQVSLQIKRKTQRGAVSNWAMHHWATGGRPGSRRGRGTTLRVPGGPGSPDSLCIPILPALQLKEPSPEECHSLREPR